MNSQSGINLNRQPSATVSMPAMAFSVLASLYRLQVKHLQCMLCINRYQCVPWFKFPVCRIIHVLSGSFKML